MADHVAALAAATPIAPLLLAVATLAGRTAAGVDRIGRWGALAAGAPAILLAAAGLARAGDPVRATSWWVLDGAGAVLLLTVAGVGVAAAAVSPTYLRASPSSRAGALGARRLYWVALALFWAALLALPLAGNLALAWILAEATTAASALLVSFSGGRTALEAGWKYLVLTSVGLTVALVGIVLLHAGLDDGAGPGALAWARLRDASADLDHGLALAAFVLVMAGLAAKAGWAPVHNWLPDAHSEAPPPVSALLSAALLPTIALVAWRLATALEPAVGRPTVTTLFVGFGLTSLAVAVPFLWRPMPWKRLLAYSSLEHMGVIAIAIGIGHPLATAGAVVHVLGHAVVKTLGFLTAVPLLRHQPAAARRPVRGLAAQSPTLAVAVSVSVGGLAALPPSPLFVSEVLILAGGVAGGLAWVSAVAAVLLALGFLGVAHVLIDGLAGRPSGRPPRGARSVLQIGILTGVAVAAQAALVVAAYRLPGSELVGTFLGAA